MKQIPNYQHLLPFSIDIPSCDKKQMVWENNAMVTNARFGLDAII